MACLPSTYISIAGCTIIVLNQGCDFIATENYFIADSSAVSLCINAKCMKKRTANASIHPQY